MAVSTKVDPKSFIERGGEIINDMYNRMDKLIDEIDVDDDRMDIIGQNGNDGLHYEEASTKQVGGTHYKEMGIEPWDVVDTWPIEQQIGAYRHGALKYVMRMGSKDASVQEIGKGIHYLEKLLEVLKKHAGS
jgi:hypothetical protein